jgi:uncharacterized spore protein YtfJ
VEQQVGPGNKPFRVQTVRGKPWDVAGRRLVPVARIITFGQGRGTIRRDRVEGWAGGFVQVVPLGVVEETDQGQRYVAISDATEASLRRILASAVIMTLLFMVLRRLIQTARG